MCDTALRQALRYRRFGATPRLLFLAADYLVVADAIAGARELGWQVAEVRPPRGHGNAAFLRLLLQNLVAFRPDYIVTINHLGFDEDGVLARLLAHYEVPVASWFVDHPVLVLGAVKGDATTLTQVFSFERSALDWLRARGYVEPQHLPTAARSSLPSADLGAGPPRLGPGGVSFVGSSWWQRARTEVPSWARSSARAVLQQPQSIQQLLDGRFAGWPHRARLEDPRARSVTAKAALAEASLRRRQSFARALQPCGLRIHGDSCWKELAPQVTLAPPVADPHELAALFRRCEVNLNVTAAQMPTAVNQRVWDVPACGGFLVTDAQQDALEFFGEDEAVVVYRSFEEALDKVQHWRRQPSRRQAVTARARAKIEAHHRYPHRLRALHAQMQRRFCQA